MDELLAANEDYDTAASMMVDDHSVVQVKEKKK